MEEVETMDLSSGNFSRRILSGGRLKEVEIVILQQRQPMFGNKPSVDQPNRTAIPNMVPQARSLALSSLDPHHQLYATAQTPGRSAFDRYVGSVAPFRPGAGIATHPGITQIAQHPVGMR